MTKLTTMLLFRIFSLFLFLFCVFNMPTSIVAQNNKTQDVLLLKNGNKTEHEQNQIF